MTNPSDEFVPPSPPGANVEYQPLNGSLLVFEVLSVEDHVPTVHTLPGEKSPAVRCNIAVLDGMKAGEDYQDALVFPRFLQSQLRRNVGRKVLGRLYQGQPRQQGQTPPWELAPASPEDNAKAQEWANRRQFAQPGPGNQPSNGQGGPQGGYGAPGGAPAQGQPYGAPQGQPQGQQGGPWQPQQPQGQPYGQPAQGGATSAPPF